MSKDQPAVVWIDHHEARIFELGPEGLHSEVVHAHPHGHSRRRNESGHPETDAVFHHAVTEALSSAQAILVVGPGTAKLELVRYAHKKAPQFEARIVAIETVDHPTDAQLVAYAKKYFKDAGERVHATA